MGINAVKLGDVATISAGQSAPKSNYFCEEGIPFVRAGSLEFLERGESIDLCEKISEDNAQICKLKLYPKNSILFAKSGMSANKGRIYKLERSAYIVSHLAIITPDETKLIPEYLMYWLQKHPPKTLIKDESYPSIGLTDIANMKMELPPLEEQKKIAKILDKADEIRAKKKLANDKLDEFLKSTFISMFGTPIANEKHWEVKKLKELATKIMSGNTPKGGSQVYVPSGIEFYRSQNVWKNRIEKDDIAYIDEATHKKMERSSLKHNDILITKTGRINTENSSLGRSALYEGEDNKANINGHVYLVRLKEGMCHRFILTILTSNEYREHIRSVCVGGIDKRQLNKEHIEDFPIIYPPIEDQNKFAQIVKKVEAQKQKNELVIEQMNNLFNSLSQQAFKGELAQSDSVDLITKQTVLHAKIIDKCNSHQTFGAVKMEKIFNLCDMSQVLNLVPGGYYRKAAGPYVPEMRHSVEEKLAQNNWVKTINKGNGKKVEFKKDTKFAEYKNLYSEIFKDYEEHINKIIDYFYDKDTDYCEAFSTLYMCWNDLILEGKNPSKFEIIDEFKNHWAPEKQRFERIYLLDILSDMLNNNFEPHGQGLHTIDSDYNVNKNQLNLQLN